MKHLQEGWFRELFMKPSQSIRDGLKQLNEKGHQFLFIVDDEDRLLGVVSDGDFRRAIFEGHDFDRCLSDVMTTSPMVSEMPVDRDHILSMMKDIGIRYVPVVDEDRKVLDVLFWQDFLVEQKAPDKTRSEPVVIMAGGKGTRLDPFTRILPKPLIPFGDRPMVEWIMDNFSKYGFRHFWMSLNYKKQTIRNYFSGVEKEYSLDFVEEKEFLGTAGALGFLKGSLNTTFIVSNCDVVLEDDFSRIVDFHKEKGHLLTIVAVPRHVKIAYGVLEMNQEVLTGIKEKPEFTYLVSGGIYVLEPSVLDHLQPNQHLEMPELIELMLAATPDRVGVYPTSGKWFDIGQWEDYQAALLKMTMGGVPLNDLDEPDTDNQV